MNSTFSKTQDNTITIKVTIPWEEVKKTQEEVIEEMVKNTTMPGFRKGMAPRKVVEKNIDKTALKEEVLRHLLPKAYLEAIQKHNLRPIIDPKIHVDSDLKDGSTWSFEAITCEKPEVELGDYKGAIGKITAGSKIVVPGKEPQEVKFEDIVKVLLENVKTTIPAILMEREVDRLLAQTIDDVKKLGLSLDQYLASTGRNADTLRAEYAAKSEGDIKLEFALQQIAEEEKIVASEEDVQKAIDAAKDPAEKKNLEANKYLLASIIRQQKTLDFLKNL
jgi:FKBP-type peptidyl-prolyl cis-trans isomerase (trigger factor)